MRVSYELRRKFIHFSALLIPIGYYFLPKELVLSVLIPGSFLCLLIDMGRLYHKPTSRVFNRIFGRVLREHEGFHFTASTYLLFAATLCIIFFDKRVAIVSLLILIISDPTAALVGRKFGRIKLLGEKTLEGSCAFLISALIITSLFPGLRLTSKIAGAIVATTIELFPTGIDDNLSIPLATGLVMQLFLKNLVNQ